MIQNLILGALALAIPYFFYKLDWNIALFVWIALCLIDLTVNLYRKTLLRDPSRAVFILPL